jgi:hypothetical protein
VLSPLVVEASEIEPVALVERFQMSALTLAYPRVVEALGLTGV